MENCNQLLKEVEDRRTYFKTESYSMSIGELINLYTNKEIVIRPEYQRLFRWTHGQKVKLIESILMGIPIPTIFVYQDQKGIWEVVDGLQRVSTILQLMGKLESKEELVLSATKYIPALNGFSWDNSNEDMRIPEELKLAIKRSKLNFTIILSESDSKAKFEVFQRLNTGGSNASAQEIRNSVMIMTNPNRYKWFDDLSNNVDFMSTLSLSDKLLEEQYHKELLLRYIALSNYSYDNNKDVGDYLDDINEIIIDESCGLDFDSIKQKFDKVFRLLNIACEDRTFKKNFKGKFLESAFEAISIGFADNVDNYEDGDSQLISNKINDLYTQEFYTDNSGSGSNAKSRINRLISPAKEYFRKNE